VGRAPQPARGVRFSSTGLVLDGGNGGAGQQRTPCALSVMALAAGIVRLGRYGGASGSRARPQPLQLRSHASIVVVITMPYRRVRHSVSTPTQGFARQGGGFCFGGSCPAGDGAGLLVLRGGGPRHCWGKVRNAGRFQPPCLRERREPRAERLDLIQADLRAGPTACARPKSAIDGSVLRPGGAARPCCSSGRPEGNDHLFVGSSAQWRSGKGRGWSLWAASGFDGQVCRGKRRSRAGRAGRLAAQATPWQGLATLLLNGGEAAGSAWGGS